MRCGEWKLSAYALSRLDETSDYGIGFDPYLGEVAEQTPSHAFLGGNMQLVYQRQIRFLAAVICARFGWGASHVRILDWGCGKGHITYLLRKEGFEVTSCDIKSSAGDSSFGQKTPIIENQHIEVTPLEDPVALPFSSETFDVVLSIGVLEHVQDDLKSLRELRRVLRPGGMCYISFLPYKISWTQRLAHAFGNYYHPKLYGRT